LNKTYKIASLPGDGIGPEVVQAALMVAQKVASQHDFQLEVTEYLVGGAAIDSVGNPFPDDTRDGLLQSDAVLLGAIGGPKWDHLQGADRPESGLLAMRKALDTFANLRPVAVPESLVENSPIENDRIEGTDMLIVRELTGGIYFSEPKIREDDYAVSTMAYTRAEIERIAEVAFQWALKRRKKVTLVDKANVLIVSQLWRDVVSAFRDKNYPEVELDYLYIDNAAMQVVLNPRQFDVVLTGNLFGDILSDLAATLPGSLGMLPSASLGGGVGLFEPVHGSAPDIAGKGLANPLATILSVAMMFDSLGEAAAADFIRNSVESVLAHGLRTADLAREGHTRVSTEEMLTALLIDLSEPTTITN